MSQPAPATVTPLPRGRYRVLGLACALSMITYLDRVCFGAAAPLVVAELGLTGVADLKWAFTAFALAYAAFEVPAGWLGDRLGPRGTLIRIVVWWSVFTALTGLIGMRVGGLTLGGVGALVAVRFLFGAGEAGAYPNITRAIHNWFPKAEWAAAQGFVWMSGRIMGGLTPFIWAVLVAGTSVGGPLVTWRGAFLLFGVLGLAWCAAFATWFRNRPDDRPEPTPTSGEPGHAVPWRAVLTSRTLLALCVMYVCINFGWYFNITYLPSYLSNRYQLADSDLLGALYKGGPLWVGALGCAAGGVLAARLSRSTGRPGRGRQVLGVTALTLASLCWLAAREAPGLPVFFALVSAAAFCNDLILGAAWATCQDIGRRNAAVVAACMNTVGTLGAATAGWVSGWLVEQAVADRAAGLGVTIPNLPAAERKSAELAGFDDGFLAYAVVYLVAAACWLIIDPNRPIGPEDDR